MDPISGSSLRGDLDIAPSIKSFYLNNKNNLNYIIFSGDVLKEPSIQKWDNFYNNFEESTKIYIAPGNHDVGLGSNNALRDIFNIVSFNEKENFSYPFYFIYKNTLFIIDDSNKEKILLTR